MNAIKLKEAHKNQTLVANNMARTSTLQIKVLSVFL